jgi:hypothetical protein
MGTLSNNNLDPLQGRLRDSGHVTKRLHGQGACGYVQGARHGPDVR